MNSFRRHRARPVPALIASLALFLVGSNYCLLGAWGGNTRMACMSTPGDASGAAVPACHHATPAAKSPSGCPVAKPSCCPPPVLVPSAPSLAGDGAVPAAQAPAFLAAADAPAPLPLHSWHGRPALPDGQPPTRLPRAPLSARAPPLA